MQSDNHTTTAMSEDESSEDDTQSYDGVLYLFFVAVWYVSVPLISGHAVQDDTHPFDPTTLRGVHILFHVRFGR